MDVIKKSVCSGEVKRRYDYLCLLTGTCVFLGILKCEEDCHVSYHTIKHQAVGKLSIMGQNEICTTNTATLTWLQMSAPMLLKVNCLTLTQAKWHIDKRADILYGICISGTCSHIVYCNGPININPCIGIVFNCCCDEACQKSQQPFSFLCVGKWFLIGWCSAVDSVTVSVQPLFLWQWAGNRCGLMCQNRNASPVCRQLSWPLSQYFSSPYIFHQCKTISPDLFAAFLSLFTRTSDFLP